MAEGVLGEIVSRKRRDVAARLDGLSFDPEPTRRSLERALAQPGARFIMEVKKASPSGHRSSAAVSDAVRAFAPVADAVSVLTDEPYFGGSLGDLETTRALFDGPILAKDFIVDSRQVAEARAHGADAVLTIMAALEDREAATIMAEAGRLGMDVLVEAHDQAEIGRALALGAKIIGINNRDLRTLKTDLAVTERLAPLVPDDCILVSESGVRGRADVLRLAPHADAFLVGSSLMASERIAEAARALVYGRVKLCGITQMDDAALAADRGATHVGLIFAEASPRRVDGSAADVADEARRRGARIVGVFQTQLPAFVAETAHRLGLDAVQLHGREEVGQFREALPGGCEIWAACGVADSVEPERGGADRIIYDTRASGGSGGTGRPFDWSLIGDRPQLGHAFVAGGIRPANARAAQQLGSYGIDVGSGVESRPGRKDAEKVGSLFAALRPQCRRTGSC